MLVVGMVPAHRAVSTQRVVVRSAQAVPALQQLIQAASHSRVCLGDSPPGSREKTIAACLSE